MNKCIPIYWRWGHNLILCPHMFSPSTSLYLWRCAKESSDKGHRVTRQPKGGAVRVLLLPPTFTFIQFHLVLSHCALRLYTKEERIWYFWMIVVPLFEISRDQQCQFSYCVFCDRTTWFHLQNPHVPMIGSCLWRIFGWRFMSRRTLLVRLKLSILW